MKPILAERSVCPACEASWQYQQDGQTYSKLIGVEYAYGSPNRYDGISEWRCPECGTRWGRWTGNELQDGESEPRYGRTVMA